VAGPVHCAAVPGGCALELEGLDMPAGDAVCNSDTPPLAPDACAQKPWPGPLADRAMALVYPVLSVASDCVLPVIDRCGAAARPSGNSFVDIGANGLICLYII
jgi:hypothetical protein